jgi:hypothetical protein
MTAGMASTMKATASPADRANHHVSKAPDIGEPRKLESGIATMNTATIWARSRKPVG